ncbi:MAG: response regulator [Hyphomonadaceae bacterium]|nr:response regulator [Hyphomonadaceae bacterium]
MGKSRPFIVVIEDDNASAAALELTLRDWGADVVCGHLSDALLRTTSQRSGAISAIIADFDLGPRPNGVTVSRRLREIAPQAPVLVLSGAFNGGAAQAAAAAGFDFMNKPAPANAITAWLERNERA